MRVEMSMFAKVRRLFHRDHLTISEIQRRTGLSRNTIKAWLKDTAQMAINIIKDRKFIVS